MQSSIDDSGTKQTDGIATGRRWRMLARRRPAESRRRRLPGMRRILKSAVNKTPATETEDPVDLDWYAPWVASHRTKLPPAVLALLGGGSRTVDDGFRAVWEAVQKIALTERGATIDEVVEQLDTAGVLDQGGCSTNSGAGDATRQLVFAFLGWQSMVYVPELNSHPLGTLAIRHDANAPESGLVFDRYVTSSEDMADRPLWVLLKSFGNLLPAHPQDVAVRAADVAAFEAVQTAASWAPLYPDQFNAYMLRTLLRVRFRWVDTLALHLDYDKSTRTLSLFAFPSMCVAHLRARESGSDHAAGNKPPGGAIFAFSSLEIDAADPRGDEDDIADFVLGVLVSFRLLFGQSAKARKIFRVVCRQVDAPFCQPDTLLARLCTEKAAPNVPLLPADRRIYYAARDFPVLYSRVQLLADELGAAKPASIRDLLNDRRDTLQFWTFWLISVFGSISIFMGIVQIVLQVIQIAQAAGKL